MKIKLFPLMALLACAPAFASDDILSPEPPVDAEAGPPVGRFQMANTDSGVFLLDTATGRMWQAVLRRNDRVLVPVNYAQPEGVDTILPDFEPAPVVVNAKPPTDPKITAEKITAAEEFVNDAINPAIMAYTLQLGEFPPSLAALSVNVRKDRRWAGPYLKQTSIDPWGNPYRYLYPGVRNNETYDVWSLGPDGEPSDDDIGNW